MWTFSYQLNCLLHAIQTLLPGDD